ncbi:hypothetical protein [Algivirga pacifica]
MTKIIIVLHKLIGTKEVVSNLLIKAKQKHPFSQVVDLGSGSGGIMPMAVTHLNTTKKEDVRLLLTDLHPNEQFIQYFNQHTTKEITYQKDALDATNLLKAPEGLKTMINSFHHMPPVTAKKILYTAQENKEPIMIYEMGENMVPALAWFLLLPISLPLMALSCMLFVPFVKPLNWKDLFFTWIIPVIPIFYAWDGQASGPRTYTFEDIQTLLPPTSEQYTWEIQPALKDNGKKLGYYIMGTPQ